jgi:hypothetical protein
MVHAMFLLNQLTLGHTLFNRANLGLIEQVLFGVQNSIHIQGFNPLRF